MLLVIIFRFIMIFPFMIYFICLLNGNTEKKSRLISASFYLLSMYFIVAYIFQTLMAALVFGAVCLAFLCIAIIKIKSKYRTIIINYVVREFLNTTGLLYPYVYIGLIIFGIIKEYITIII